MLVGLSCFVLLAVLGDKAAGQQSAESYYKEGMSLYREGKYAEAEERFQKALNITKEEKELHYKRGLALYEQGRYKEAEQEFAQVMAMKEKENDQHYKQGLLLYQQGNYIEAQREFKKAISTITEEKTAAAESVSVITEEKSVPSLNAAAAPVPAAVSAASLPSSTAVTTEYLISNGDLLLIKVWQNPDLDTEAIVRPDGMVSFPLVGDIPATGISINAFRQTLTERLKEYIKNPQVSVSIRTIAGRRVIILGQVLHPGVYSVTGRNTILEAIGLAGGFTEDAVTSSVMLIKGGFAKPVPTRLDLTKALKHADVSDNVILESEDMVYVPRRFVKDVNYFLRLFLDPVTQGFFIRRELRDY